MPEKWSLYCFLIGHRPKWHTRAEAPLASAPCYRSVTGCNHSQLLNMNLLLIVSLPFVWLAFWAELSEFMTHQCNAPLLSTTCSGVLKGTLNAPPTRVLRKSFLKLDLDCFRKRRWVLPLSNSMQMKNCVGISKYTGTPNKKKVSKQGRKYLKSIT